MGTVNMSLLDITIVEPTWAHCEPSGATKARNWYGSSTAFLITLVVGCAVPSTAQTIPVVPSSATTVLQIGFMPGELQDKAKAPGTRLTTPGLERVILTGSLTRNGAACAVTITLQLPNKTKVDCGQGKVVGFDGSTAWNAASAISADDQDLLESLSSDSPEVFFYNVVAQTYRLRPLVHRARMDDGTTPNYAGPWMDIYQQIGPAMARTDKAVRVKHFYFDSITHLPVRVRYLSPTGSRIEVVRSQWALVQGQHVPLQIDRYQDGVLTHHFVGNAANISATANDATFTH